MVPSYDQKTEKVNDYKSNDYLRVSIKDSISLSITLSVTLSIISVFGYILAFGRFPSVRRCAGEDFDPQNPNLRLEITEKSLQRRKKRKIDI